MKHPWMTKLAMAFETAADGGGAGASAVADKTAAADGGSGGGAADAGDSFSFLRNVPTRDLTPKEDVVKEVEAGAAGADGAGEVGAGKDGAAAADAGEKFNVVDEDGTTVLKAFDTQAEAEEYAAQVSEERKKSVAGAEPEKDGAAAADAGKLTPETKLPIKIFNRFETIKEVEEYLAQSGAHAKQLSDQNKVLKESAKVEIERGLVTRDAEIASLKAELEIARKTPPFQTLSEEQEEALGKESPAKLARYLIAKEKNEAGLQKAKDEASKATTDRQKRNEALGAEIQRLEREMRTDTKKWPLYEKVEPMMEKIFQMSGGEKSPLVGKPWAKVLCYYAALGGVHVGLLQKGETVKKDANEHARRTANAGAAATGAPAAVGAGANKPIRVNPNKAWEQKIDEAGGKRVLSFTD